MRWKDGERMGWGLRSLHHSWLPTSRLRAGQLGSKYVPGTSSISVLPCLQLRARAAECWVLGLLAPAGSAGAGKDLSRLGIAGWAVKEVGVRDLSR